MMGSEAGINKYRILIVDDHPLVREGLRHLVANERDLEVCGEADDSAEALRQIKNTGPDVAVVDISLKSSHGIDLIEEIKRQNDRIKVLVSSMHDETLFAERCLRAGAMGYINKEESPAILIGAIRQVLRGEIFLSQRMTNRILKRVGGMRTVEHDPIELLTNREVEVFEMLGQGLSTKQIARRLDLSPKTIESHREKIKQKLNLANSSELVRRATQWVIENS